MRKNPSMAVIKIRTVLIIFFSEIPPSRKKKKQVRLSGLPYKDSYATLSYDFFLKLSLRKHAHAIYRDFLSYKNENLQQNSFDIFLIFAQNIDCGYTLGPPRRGGSNEYPQSMFWSKNKKNRYTPANPSFTL